MDELLRSLRELRRLLAEDLATHDGRRYRPGYRALQMYRFGSWRRQVDVRGVNRLLTMVYARWHRRIRSRHGIELHDTATVGRRVRIAHGSGIVIHRHATIGDDVLIRHGVTIGGGAVFSMAGAPVVEDDVELGAGAVIVGAVTVGRGSSIGPNAVVTRNVAPRSIVVVEPPRTIPRPS